MVIKKLKIQCQKNIFIYFLNYANSNKKYFKMHYLSWCKSKGWVELRRQWSMWWWKKDKKKQSSFEKALALKHEIQSAALCQET